MEEWRDKTGLLLCQGHRETLSLPVEMPDWRLSRRCYHTLTRLGYWLSLISNDFLRGQRSGWLPLDVEARLISGLHLKPLIQQINFRSLYCSFWFSRDGLLFSRSISVCIYCIYTKGKLCDRWLILFLFMLFCNSCNSIVLSVHRLTERKRNWCFNSQSKHLCPLM